jgi:DNA-binding NarL/FixJ family response regulator
VGGKLVAVLEERRLIRDALTSYLTQCDDFEIVAVVDTTEELVAACRAGTIDSVVVSLLQPRHDLLDLPVRLGAFRRNALLVALVPGDDAALARNARRVGFDVVTTSDSGFAGVAAALRTAPVINLARRRNRQLRALDDGAPVLTEREVQVLQLISNGLTAKEISDELEISPKTVENHKQRASRTR